MFNRFTCITFKLSKFTDVEAFFPVTLKKISLYSSFNVFSRSCLLLETGSPFTSSSKPCEGLAVCRAKVVYVPSLFRYFETPSIGLALGIDPTTHGPWPGPTEHLNIFFLNHQHKFTALFFSTRSTSTAHVC